MALCLPHLGRPQIGATKTTSTTLLHTYNRMAAKETSEQCAHAFIGWVTLSQEPARERRGLRSLSGSLPRLVTLIGVGGPDSMSASQEWAGLGGGRRKGGSQTTILALSEVSLLVLPWCAELLFLAAFFSSTQSLTSLGCSLPSHHFLWRWPFVCPRELFAAPLSSSRLMFPLAPLSLPF